MSGPWSAPLIILLGEAWAKIFFRRLLDRWKYNDVGTTVQIGQYVDEL